MTIQDILQSFILPGITSVGVVWFLREWISARLRQGIQHEYDQKLETHKAQLKTESEKSILELQNEIEKQTTLYETAIASFSEGQKSTMERKLDSVETLWVGVVKLRGVVPPAISVIDVLRYDEVKIETFNEIKKLMWNIEDYKKKVGSVDFVSIEKGRPYVGEYLWAIFSCYQLIHLRLPIQLLAPDNIDVTKLKWFTDEIIYQVTRSVLSEDEFVEFNKLEFGKFLWLQRKLEEKILTASRKIISGEEIGPESLKQAEMIQEHISKAKIPEVPFRKNP